MSGLSAEGLGEPLGLLPPLLATPGDARDFGRGEGLLLERGDPPVLLPVPVLVPVFEVVPVPEVAVDERRLEVTLDSSNFTSWPTTKLFVVTKFTIHSGISPLLVFCFACFGDVFPGERLVGLLGAALSWSVSVEGGVGVPGLKN